MRITIDTEKKIFIVPNTFESQLNKQNAFLKSMGVDKVITPKSFIDDAIAAAYKRPILTQEQAKEWNPDLENQFVQK